MPKLLICQVLIYARDPVSSHILAMRAGIVHLLSLVTLKTYIDRILELFKTNTREAVFLGMKARQMRDAAIKDR